MVSVTKTHYTSQWTHRDPWRLGSRPWGQLLPLRWMEIDQLVVRLAVGGDARDDDLPGPAVVKLKAIRPIGLNQLGLLGRKMQVPGQDPVPRAGLRQFLLQLDVNVLDPISADQKIAIDFMHGPTLRMKDSELPQPIINSAKRAR